VSATGKDEFKFAIKTLELFKTPDGEKLTLDAFDGGKPEVNKMTPPIIIDEQ